MINILSMLLWKYCNVIPTLPLEEASNDPQKNISCSCMGFFLRRSAPLLDSRAACVSFSSCWHRKPFRVSYYHQLSPSTPCSFSSRSTLVPSYVWWMDAYVPLRFCTEGIPHPPHWYTCPSHWGTVTNPTQLDSTLGQDCPIESDRYR